jgi:hypothetical protein
MRLALPLGLGKFMQIAQQIRVELDLGGRKGERRK